MNKLNIFLFISCTLYLCSGLPVKEKKDELDHQPTQNEHQEGDDWELSLEYGRYLKEVVQALESDPEFRKKLETANVDDIKSGKISRELHLVDHNVRTQLDELKRRELERLRHIAIKEHEKKTGVDRSKLKIPVHVDHRNPERFEAEDLRKLITQLNHDLELVDQKREKEFKSYELEKEYQYKHELEGMDEEHRKRAVKDHEEQLQKHKQHPKLHHPGSKQQLEEVWEEQDHMKAEDFDPRTFFHVHDLDGNNYWDETEVKALFQKELDKMYDPNAPEDDQMERYEEMERMREHVFGETDVDKNKLISYDEFLEQTKKSDFERDEGWQGLDEQELYSQQEYEEYERERQHEIQKLIESGAIDPPPGYYGADVPQPLVLGESSHSGGAGVPPVPINIMDNVPQEYHAIPQGYQAAPQGQGYQAAPQGQRYQAAPQGQRYQAVPQGQGYQAVPQGQGYQAVPQGQGYQAVPQGQGYQAVPQGQGYQAVPQGQGYQAVPQGQGYQAVPQGQGYQAVPQGQGYQAVPQGQGYQAVPQGQGYQAVPQGQGYQAVPQRTAQAQAVPQPQGIPQAQAIPQPQGIPQAQAIPQPQGIPQAQAIPQPQGIPQAQGVPQGRVQATVKKTPDDHHQQQPGGVVLQHESDNLNQHPEIKPVAGNQLPGSN